MPCEKNCRCCNGNHHQSICRHQTHCKSQHDLSANKNSQETQNSTMVTQSTDVSQLPQMTTTGRSGTKGTVLLKTASAIARNENSTKSTRVKILLTVEVRDLKLADYSDSEDSTDVLIGSDYYWDFVTSEIVQGDFGPTTVNSKFGWLLSGPKGSIISQETTVTNLTITRNTNSLFEYAQDMSLILQNSSGRRSRCILMEMLRSAVALAW